MHRTTRSTTLWVRTFLASFKTLQEDLTCQVDTLRTASSGGVSLRVTAHPPGTPSLWDASWFWATSLKSQLFCKEPQKVCWAQLAVVAGANAPTASPRETEVLLWSSERKDYTFVTFQIAARSTKKPLTWRHTCAGMPASGPSSATGSSAERASRAQMSCRGIFARTPGEAFRLSAVWEKVYAERSPLQACEDPPEQEEPVQSASQSGTDALLSNIKRE